MPQVFNNESNGPNVLEARIVLFDRIMMFKTVAQTAARLPLQSSLVSSTTRLTKPLLKASVAYAAGSRLAQWRKLHASSRKSAASNSLLGLSNSSFPSSYFQKPSLPANTIIRFVPQQTAWIVERMGKFHRILQPGFAILYPFIDRIAYVKSLKEVAFDIPSQSAITADNVTLDLDGVLFIRVVDAYKARYLCSLPIRL